MSDAIAAAALLVGFALGATFMHAYYQAKYGTTLFYLGRRDRDKPEENR